MITFFAKPHTNKDVYKRQAEDIRLMAVTDPRTPVEAKEALDAFKRSSKPKRTGKPDAVEDVTEMPETIDMAEDEKQADW